MMIDERTLNIIREGKVTMSINGRPLVSLDSDSKSIGVEISGLKENGLKLSNLFETKMNKGRVFLETSHLLRKLAKNGWSFSVYDRGERLLTTKSFSKLGRHLGFNPLRLKRILEVL
jgi:hypothetical protein